jgi:hypothetical protein
MSHEKEHGDLHKSSCIVMVLKSSRLQWAGHVARMMVIACMILVWKRLGGYLAYTFRSFLGRWVVRLEDV